MEEEIPYTRGELISKLSKFKYREDAIQLLGSTNLQLGLLEEEISMYPSEEKYLLTQRDKLKHKTDLIRRRALLRQRTRLMQKIQDLESSIKNDIQASKTQHI